jgi:hypothetical protein
MTTDYILFIHGVSTRNKREQPTYADELYRLIEKNVGSSLQLKKVALYWGDVNKDPEDKLLEALTASPDWKNFWFREFREKQLMQFFGDAALYLSSYIGSQVVERLNEQTIAKGQLREKQQTDRIHLVAHSWGTVILFDLLFADRWEKEEIAGYQTVQNFRKIFFGLQPNAMQGIRLASIHTMGSPIALFSLLTLSGPSSRDFTPKLKELLDNLHKVMGGKKLPWQNFAHPGDPVAWPLASLMPTLVAESSNYVNIQDVITHKRGFSDYLLQPLSQTILALVHGGDAHGSYWKSDEVAQKIAQTIQSSANGNP